MEKELCWEMKVLLVLVAGIGIVSSLPSRNPNRKLLLPYSLIPSKDLLLKIPKVEFGLLQGMEEKGRRR